MAWCEVVYVGRKEFFLCSLIITMFERNYDALAIILHTKYITDDVYTVYTICYTSASESESESAAAFLAVAGLSNFLGEP